MPKLIKEIVGKIDITFSKIFICYLYCFFSMIYETAFLQNESSQRKLSAEELMLLDCSVGEDSWTSLGLQGESILKEISPKYSLEGLILKLKLQYFGHLMQRTDNFEETLMLGMTEGGRRRGWQKVRWLDGITDVRTLDWQTSRSWWWRGKPGVLQSMGSQRVRYQSNQIFPFWYFNYGLNRHLHNCDWLLCSQA